MTVPAPAGEESCDDAVAPKRSRRRPPSGRSAHHQRPLDAGWDSDTTEIKATLKARQENRTGTTSDETTAARSLADLCLPLPCCLAAHAAPSGSGRSAWWQQKDDVRTMPVTGPSSRSIRAETPPQPAQLDVDL